MAPGGNEGAGAGAGAGTDASAGTGGNAGAAADTAVQQHRQSDDAVEAGAAEVVGVDSIGAQVIRQTTFNVAEDADSQSGVQRGRGSGNSSHRQLARAHSADSRVHSYRRQPVSKHLPPQQQSQAAAMALVGSESG